MGISKNRQMNYEIEKIETKTTWDAQTAVGNVEVLVGISNIETDASESVVQGLYLTSSDAYAEPVLCAGILDREGKEMDRIFPLPLESEMQFCMRVEKPQLWNAEDPFCYQLVLEIMEGENFCQDRRVEPLAFRSWKIADGQTCINDRAVEFRAAALPDGMKEPEKILQFLQKMKQTWKNTLLVRTEENSSQLKKWCMEYGIYLLEEGKDVDVGWLRARLDQGCNTEKNPDFQLQVVQTGALIENRSTFVNTSEYELHYEILDSSGRKVSGNELCTEIPAGTSRFVDIPFKHPQEPGEYIYRVALCLKQDTVWAPQGYALASAETKISNLYQRLENHDL